MQYVQMNGNIDFIFNWPFINGFIISIRFDEKEYIKFLHSMRPLCLLYVFTLTHGYYVIIFLTSSQ